MIRIMYSLLFLVLLTSLAAAVTPETRVCNFDGENRDRVYTIHTRPGVGTTFRLPDGWEIQDFVVTDARAFFGQSNGVIGTVKPLEADRDTAVVITTPTGRLFTFHLASRNVDTVDVLVVIDVHDEEFFTQTVARRADALVREQMDTFRREQAAAAAQAERAAREQALRTANSAYQVKADWFDVEQVVDDGVFTYIWLPRAQERPAVFVHPEGKKKAAEFQPVKFVDNGAYYTVHRVLRGKEKFFLKYGDRLTEVAAR